MADAMPASWLSDRWMVCARRAWPGRATVPLQHERRAPVGVLDHLAVVPLQTSRGAQRLGERLLGREPGGQRGQRQRALGRGEQPFAQGGVRASARTAHVDDVDADPTITTSIPMSHDHRGRSLTQHRGVRCLGAVGCHSTVTDLARLRGWSTS